MPTPPPPQHTHTHTHKKKTHSEKMPPPKTQISLYIRGQTSDSVIKFQKHKRIIVACSATSMLHFCFLIQIITRPPVRNLCNVINKYRLAMYSRGLNPSGGTSLYSTGHYQPSLMSVYHVYHKFCNRRPEQTVKLQIRYYSM